MAIKRISDLHDWELVHRDQDIRGWEMQDETGTKIGTVTDLIADTDREMISKVVLDNGEEIPARDIEIADGVVHARGTHTATDSGPVVKVYDETPIRRGTGAAAGSAWLFTDYADTFRTHHASNYATTGHTYDVFEPAYRTGFDYGVDNAHRERSYIDLEPEMRSAYEGKHGEGTWDRVKDAVRHAFDKARGLGTSSDTTRSTTGATPRSV